MFGDWTVTTCFSFVMSEIPTPHHQYTVQGKFQHCQKLTLSHLLNINSKELFPSVSKLQSTCIILANAGQYFYKVPFEKFVFGVSICSLTSLSSSIETSPSHGKIDLLAFKQKGLFIVPI